MGSFIFRILFIFLIFFSGIYSSCFAQNGSIIGSIRDSSNTSTLKDSVFHEPIIGANILLEGKNMGASSDEEGNFEIIDVPPGTYNIIINYTGYNTKIISNVEVKADEETRVYAEIKNSTELTEIVVQGTRVKDSEEAVVNEIKKSDLVISGISREQISKTQARTAAEVVKSVSGVTVVEDRFVMIRGLSERYNTVLLNNAITPSAEQDVKAFSFDIIPSSAIDRVIIYKSPAPEISGEFAGGVIKVYTVDIPRENSFTIGYSSSIRKNTTGHPFITQKKGKYEWLGYDDGTFKLSNDFYENFTSKDPLIDKNKVARLLPNNYQTKLRTAPIDHRFNLGFSRRIKLSDKIIFGTSTTLNYSNTNATVNTSRVYTNQFDSFYFDLRENSYNESKRLGVIQNFAVKIGKRHVIDIKNLYSHLGNSEYVHREGARFERNSLVIRRLYYKSYRGLYAGQINGQHTLFSNIKLDWTGGYSETNKDEPDFRLTQQFRNVLDSTYFNQVPATNDYQSGGKLYLYNIETSKMASANINIPLVFNKENYFIPEIRVGAYLEEKNKRSETKIYIYGSQNPSPLLSVPYDSLYSDYYLNKPNGLTLREYIQSDLNYIASNKLLAYYGGVFFPITKKLNLYPGVRIENNTQILGRYNAHIVSVLPSVNLNYSLTDKSQLRFAYGKTLNRPEFREVSNVYLFDFMSEIYFTGNPLLKTPVIQNFDLRYEIYPNFGETFSLGIFYKRFINPIERTVYNNPGNFPEYTFRNALDARSIGIEFDIRKSFSTILKGKDIFDNFYLVSNLSLINNKVSLAPSVFEETERPMAGQSPYIINSMLNYSNDSIRLDISLVYNIIGRRLYLIGNTSTPTIHEMPRHQLDLTVSKRMGKYLEIRGGISDILNSRYQFLFDYDLNRKLERSGKIDQEFMGFNRFPYFTFGVNLRL